MKKTVLTGLRPTGNLHFGHYLGCVQCKKELISAMEEFLKPIKEKRSYYEAHPEEVNKILSEGTKRAQKEAKKIISDVKHSMMIDYDI